MAAGRLVYTQERIDAPQAPAGLAGAMIRAGLGPQFHWSGPPALADGSALRVAMIGTRQPSRAGLDAMEALATQLALLGVTVVSGAAEGTDRLAHRAALQAGGSTIACLPQGMDHVDWPRWRPEFAALPSRDRLLLVSPFLPSQRPTRSTPVVRNRLISALSQVVVAGEAGPRSGTFHCLQAAAEMGIPIFFLVAEDSDPELAAVQQGLARKRAIGFTAQEALGSSLPERLLAAGREFLRADRQAADAQQTLF